MTTTTQRTGTASPGAVPEWTLGWRLQRALDYASLKAEDIGDELGVSRGTVSRWLHDKGPVRPIYLRHWAMRTGVSLDWLNTGHVESPDPVADKPKSKPRSYSSTSRQSATELMQYQSRAAA